MAISKKHSRRIVVDGVTYHWRVPLLTESNHRARDGHIIASVWSEEGNGQILRLIGGFLSSETGLPTDPLTPRLVAEGIRNALAAGWNPSVKGKTFSLRLPRPTPTT